MILANILQAINMAITPIIAFAISNTTKGVFVTIGLITSGICLICLFIIVKNLDWHNIGLRLGLSSGKELVRYGFPRVPGDFAMAGLMSLPAVFTAHIAGIRKAGYVAFGVSVLNMTGGFFAPVGLILLPKASQLIASGDLNLLKHYVTKLIKISFLLTVPFLIIFELFADRIIQIYLGNAFVHDVTGVVRGIMIAGVSHVIYVSLRSVLDACYERPVNAINILVSLLLFLVLSGISVLLNKGYVLVIASFVIASYVLGGLSLHGIREVFRK